MTKTLRIAAWLLAAVSIAADGPVGGVLPKDEAGRPLNLGFEDGTFADWTAAGDAFDAAPVRGDAVAARRSDMKSRHDGEFWAGSFERGGDRARGTLTSAPFLLAEPFATFRIGGGTFAETRFEVVRRDDGKVIFKASGGHTEEMSPFVADLSAYRGQRVFLRLVDDSVVPWGHVNFDDFRLHATRPAGVKPYTQMAADSYAHAGLSPEDAARAMTVPEGFSVSLFAGEPDVKQPIAFTIDEKGRLWVAEAYSYPIRVPEDQARDRILIFEDTDGDGSFDTRKVFADTLNLVSGIEVGFGGVWVGSAPNFLFIPDRDRDDRPDGPPVVLLDGWGYQDTHETLNSFNWGPDGWLYGCHGVFTQSRVGKPGTPDADRTPINAGIWRYHPTKHVFEVFAHGTSNPWGIDFDANGQGIQTSCVIPHLYHMIQGGRYERQAGQHFDPYTYDDIKTIADHRHFLGSNPHAGNGRSSDAGGGHAHCGALIYQGGAWPSEYRGSVFMNNIHGARLNRDVPAPAGSGFVGVHAPDFLFANDSWSQIISLRTGPDGNVYFIDWYDREQCHQRAVDAHDRGNGRIFKVSYKGTKPALVDLSKLGNGELVALQRSSNNYFVNQSRRLLQERAAASPEAAGEIIGQVNALMDMGRAPIEQLRGLWAGHAAGGAGKFDVRSCLSYTAPYIRAWAVQLLMEDRKNPGAEVMGRFVEMARTDPSPVVRLYLASALQRMKPEDRWAILEGLASHTEDATDHNLPLMYWYAAEPLATADMSRALALATAAKVPTLLPFMVRRIAAIGTPEAVAMLVDGVARAGQPGARRTILRGMNEAFRGRRRVDMPAVWPAAFATAQGDPETRSQAVALGVTFGDPAAFASMRAVLVEAGSPVDLRREALASLLKAQDPGLAATLQSLIADPALRRDALRGLAGFDDPKTPAAILDAYAGFAPEERRDALNALASRAGFARDLLDAVAAGRVPAADLTADLVRQIRNHKDSEVDAKVARVWGSARGTSEDKAKLIARYRKLLTSAPPQKPDPSLGRAVFAKSCQQCHTLFGEGGKVGPELTGSNRADLDYVLSNVLDPGALIGKDYLAHVVATADGRVITGIVRAEDKDSLTLVTANETLVLPKADIEARRPSDASMMPDDLWAPLSEHEVRSLVGYLASPAQVPAKP